MYSSKTMSGEIKEWFKKNSDIHPFISFSSDSAPYLHIILQCANSRHLIRIMYPSPPEKKGFACIDTTVPPLTFIEKINKQIKGRSLSMEKVLDHIALTFKRSFKTGTSGVQNISSSRITFQKEPIVSSDNWEPTKNANCKYSAPVIELVEESSTKPAPNIAEESLTKLTPNIVGESLTKLTPNIVEKSLTKLTPNIVEESLIKLTPNIVEESLTKLATNIVEEIQTPESPVEITIFFDKGENKLGFLNMENLKITTGHQSDQTIKEDIDSLNKFLEENQQIVSQVDSILINQVDSVLINADYHVMKEIQNTINNSINPDISPQEIIDIVVNDDDTISSNKLHIILPNKNPLYDAVISELEDRFQIINYNNKKENPESFISFSDVDDPMGIYLDMSSYFTLI